MSDTLTVIMTHSKVQDTFDRHLPHWLRVSPREDILVAMPSGDTMHTDLMVTICGANQHNGPEVNRKVKQLFRFMEKFERGRFVFHEYDSLILAPEIPNLDDSMLWGNRFVNNGEKRFKGSQYFHPPITMSKAVLAYLNKVLDGIPDEAELGFWDRLIGYACDVGQLAASGYEQLGFARNTVEPRMIPEAVAARKAGAVFFHGVKSEAALNAILNA